MAALPPTTRRTTEGACAIFLSEPSSATSQVTLSFCSLALTGSFDTRTFATTAPNVRPPPDSPVLQTNPIPHFNEGVFDVYPDDD